MAILSFAGGVQLLCSIGVAVYLACAYQTQPDTVLADEEFANPLAIDGDAPEATTEDSRPNTAGMRHFV